MPVEGVSLSDWIQQDPQRGTLEPVDERLTLWKVPEESIPAIRDILWKTGQIFDWNKYCPPPLSPEEAEEFIRRSQACIEAEIAAELGGYFKSPNHFTVSWKDFSAAFGETSMP